VTAVRTITDNDTGVHEKYESVAHGLEIDTDRDSRNCRQPDCHGSLAIRDEWVICTSCRCTPDGIFVPPDEESENTIEDGQCSQFTWFHPLGQGRLNGENPHPADGENGVPRYRNSKNVRLIGGVEEVYNEDESIRPAGVDDEYTFDLTTY